MATSKKTARYQSRFQKVGQIVIFFVLITFVLGAFVGGLFSGSGLSTKNPPKLSQSGSPSDENSIEQWKEAVRLNPKDPFAFRNLTRALMAKGATREAEKALQQAVKLSPNDPLNDELLGRIAFAEGKGSRAIRFFKKVLKAKPEDPVLLFETAQAYSLYGDQKTASSYYEKVVLHYPDSFPGVRSRYALMNIAFGDGNYEEAKKQAFALDRLSPGDPQILAYLGAIAEKQNRVPEAILYYEAIRKKQPKNLDVVKKLAALYGKKGDNSGAFLLWMELVKKIPDDPEIKYQLALAALKLGKKEQAKDLLERSLKETETAKNEDLKKKIQAALQGKN